MLGVIDLILAFAFIVMASSAMSRRGDALFLVTTTTSAACGGACWSGRSLAVPNIVLFVDLDLIVDDAFITSDNRRFIIRAATTATTAAFPLAGGRFLTLASVTGNAGFTRLTGFTWLARAARFARGGSNIIITLAVESIIQIQIVIQPIRIDLSRRFTLHARLFTAAAAATAARATGTVFFFLCVSFVAATTLGVVLLSRFCQVHRGAPRPRAIFVHLFVFAQFEIGAAANFHFVGGALLRLRRRLFAKQFPDILGRRGQRAEQRLFVLHRENVLWFPTRFAAFALGRRLNNRLGHRLRRELRFRLGFWIRGTEPQRTEHGSPMIARLLRLRLRLSGRL